MSNAEIRKKKREKKLLIREIVNAVAISLLFVLFVILAFLYSRYADKKVEERMLQMEIELEEQKALNIAEEEALYDIQYPLVDNTELNIYEGSDIKYDSGTFTVTHYCGCETCCGIYSGGSEEEAYGCRGQKLTPYYSIAADPNVIPYGTICYDEEGNKYRVEDVGGWIKGYHIDLFVGDHELALKEGVKEIELHWEVQSDESN